jgi:hypothetical protein
MEYPMVRPHSRNEATPANSTGQAKRSTASVPDAIPSLEPIELISRSMLCRLKIWDDAEWAALSENERPRDFVHVRGLGWVGAVPIEGLN